MTFSYIKIDQLFRSILWHKTYLHNQLVLSEVMRFLTSDMFCYPNKNALDVPKHVIKHPRTDNDIQLAESKENKKVLHHH